MSSAAHRCCVALAVWVLSGVLWGCGTEQVVQGAAQLTVANAAAVVSTVFSDRRCGFASEEVQRTAVFKGQVGGKGEAVYTIATPCALDFGIGHEVIPECMGTPVYAGGRVTVTGSMHITGVLTGSAAFPIIPTGREAVEVSFDAEYDNFKSWFGESDAALTILRGGLSGAVRPRLSIDATTGACSIPSPDVEFRRLKYHDAAAVLDAQGRRFELSLSASNLEAQAGTNGTRTNYLGGAIVANGGVFTIPTSGPPVLDPGADGSKPAPTGRCSPTTLLARSDDDCSLEHVLGVGAARLTIQTAGAVAGLVASNQSCGFASPVVQLMPTDVEGDEGEMGEMSWAVRGCDVGYSLTASPADCLGGQLFIGGQALAQARLTARGVRTKVLFADAVTPNSPDAVTLHLDAVQLFEFTAFQLAPGTASPVGRLTIHSGTLSGVVRPTMGEQLLRPGVFDVATPVAMLEQVSLRNATATLETNGMSFALAIPESTLSAVNGRHGGRVNALTGSLTLNGKQVHIEQSPLDPAFDQRRFDEAYVCTPNLRAVVAD